MTATSSCALTGKPAWSATNRVSNFGSLVVAGSVLASVPEKSGLIIFRPSRDRFEEVARYRLTDEAVYAFPVFSGHRVYLRDARSVSCYECAP